MKKKNGFTIIELVVVISILGIISYVAMSRFSSVDAFSQRGNIDQVKFLLKTAQKLATTQRRAVYTPLYNNVLSICYKNTNPCPIGQNLIVGNTPFVVDVSKTTIVIPSGLYFNSLGNTDTGKVTVQVGSKNIYIEEESGLVHE
ncbi:type II secretion system protein [archaeon]|nr:type II secretion system protein [archaeon]